MRVIRLHHNQLFRWIISPSSWRKKMRQIVWIWKIEVDGVIVSHLPINHSIPVLDWLPTQFREEILKQYDLPNTKVSIFTIFKYGTPLEYAMQFLGILMAITAGPWPISTTWCWLFIGVALPLITVVMGNMTNLFGALSSPDTPSLTPPAMIAEFNAKVVPWGLLT